jgi:hypothetical protein
MLKPKPGKQSFFAPTQGKKTNKRVPVAEAVVAESTKKRRHSRRVPLGTTFQKDFGADGCHVGTVTEYDRKEDLYMVTYKDGDFEEMNWKDMSKFLTQSGDTIVPSADDLGTSLTPSTGDTSLVIDVGTTFHKTTATGQFEGKVLQFKHDTNTYSVEWEDGSCNNLTAVELKSMITRTALADLVGKGKNGYVYSCHNYYNLTLCFHATSICDHVNCILIVPCQIYLHTIHFSF